MRAISARCVSALQGRPGEAAPRGEECCTMGQSVSVTQCSLSVTSTIEKRGTTGRKAPSPQSRRAGAVETRHHKPGQGPTFDAAQEPAFPTAIHLLPARTWQGPPDGGCCRWVPASLALEINKPALAAVLTVSSHSLSQSSNVNLPVINNPFDTCPSLSYYHINSPQL